MLIYNLPILIITINASIVSVVGVANNEQSPLQVSSSSSDGSTRHIATAASITITTDDENDFNYHYQQYQKPLAQHYHYSKRELQQQTFPDFNNDQNDDELFSKSLRGSSSSQFYETADASNTITTSKTDVVGEENTQLSSNTSTDDPALGNVTKTSTSNTSSSSDSDSDFPSDNDNDENGPIITSTNDNITIVTTDNDSKNISLLNNISSNIPEYQQNVISQDNNATKTETTIPPLIKEERLSTRTIDYGDSPPNSLIELGNNIIPYGISNGHSIGGRNTADTMFVSILTTSSSENGSEEEECGGIISIDARTGTKLQTIVSPSNNYLHVSPGIHYDEKYNAIFMSGTKSIYGSSSFSLSATSMYMYNVSISSSSSSSGEGEDNSAGRLNNNEIISCQQPTSHNSSLSSSSSNTTTSSSGSASLPYDLADVTVIRSTAYYIDSNNPLIVVLDIDEALGGNCTVSHIDLPSTFIKQQSQKNQQEDPTGNDNTVTSSTRNSICSIADGLVITNMYTGGVYYLDLMSNDDIMTSFVQFINDDTLVNQVNGCFVQGTKLYLTQRNNRISVWDVTYNNGNDEDNPITATMVGYLTSGYYSNPLMSIIQSNHIYTINENNYGNTLNSKDNSNSSITSTNEVSTTPRTTAAATTTDEPRATEEEESFPIVSIRNVFKTLRTSAGDDDYDDDMNCKSGPFTGHREWEGGIVLLKDGEELHSCCDCIDDWYFIPDSTLFMKQRSNGELVLRNGTAGNSILVWESGAVELDDSSSSDNKGSSDSNEAFTIGTAFTRLQRDGNLVTRSGSNKRSGEVLWKTGVTDSINRNYFLGLTNDMMYVELWKGTPKVPDRTIVTMRTKIGMTCQSGPFGGQRSNWKDGIVLLKDGDELHSCCDCKKDWYYTDGTDIYMKQRSNGNFVIRLGSPGDSILLWESGIDTHKLSATIKNNPTFVDTNNAAYTRLQRDGNLITRLGSTKLGETLWASDTSYRKNRNYFLGITNDLKLIQLWKGTPKSPDRILKVWNTLK